MPGNDARMNAFPQPSRDPMDRARRLIEANLDSALSLADLADAACLSPYHFSRLFTGRYGFSPMAYVRARRLEGAAERLRGGHASLIDLALDCGFDSQEGFTRAFTRSFGVSPGRYRAGERPPRKENPVMAHAAHLPATNLTQAPAPARKPAIRIAGAARDFDDTTVCGIPALWDELTPHLPLPGQASGWTYGVCCAGPAPKELHYIAGVELAQNAPDPEGFEVIELPARAYLVFRQVLDGGPLHPQMQSAVREIWGERVPNCGHKLVRAPDLEVYPDHFHPETPGAWVEWWIPVEG